MTPRRAWPAASLLLLLAAARMEPVWSFDPAAGALLKSLWASSSAERRERVACLGGIVGSDSVRVTDALLLEVPDADSLAASAETSIERCAPPEWIGTAHTHVRSTDDDAPAPRFSPGDRAVMSEWSARYGRPGAFCVLWSERNAHCEVYPPPSLPGDR